MSRLILSVLLVAAVAFAKAEDVEKLVGAHDAYPGLFPYVVSLRLNNEHLCGGAIISQYHILTAAHCVKALENYIDHVSVVSGAIYLDQGGEIYAVENMWSHPDYDGKRKINHDIGVIKLADPIVYNSYQSPISLPSARPPTETYGIIGAWGQVSASQPTSNVLQYLYLYIISLNQCRRYVELDVDSTAICTYDGRGHGLCNGDSGSPFVYNNQVVGVVSRGIPCAVGVPDVFTSVYDTLPFIEAAMQY